jgi:hypothetical protein
VAIRVIRVLAEKFSGTSPRISGTGMTKGKHEDPKNKNLKGQLHEKEQQNQWLHSSQERGGAPFFMWACRPFLGDQST